MPKLQAAISQENVLDLSAPRVSSLREIRALDSERELSREDTCQSHVG
jgi:hypothetical protein